MSTWRFIARAHTTGARTPCRPTRSRFARPTHRHTGTTRSSARRDRLLRADRASCTQLTARRMHMQLTYTPPCTNRLTRGTHKRCPHVLTKQTQSQDYFQHCYPVQKCLPHGHIQRGVNNFYFFWNEMYWKVCICSHDLIHEEDSVPSDGAPRKVLAPWNRRGHGSAFIFSFESFVMVGLGR
jgi:hypothetical protein